MIPAPAVDERRAVSFFQELRRYAPHYTPDLNLTDEQGVGVALMRIFAQLAETITARLDRTPDKNFVAFLDQLGIRLLPARPARAAVTFRLASGLQDAVSVPTGTRVTAQGEESDIPFETTGELIAIPSVLTAAYGVDPLKDKIFGPPRDFLKQESRTPTELGYKIQSFVAAHSNRLQLDHTTELEPESFILIGCKEKHVIQKKEDGGFVTLYEPVSQDFPAETSVKPIRNFEVFDGIDQQEHGLYLGHSTLFTVKEEVEIKLKVELKDGETGLQPLDLVWQFWTKDESVTPEQEEHWEDLTVKFDRTTGFASNGEIVLVKKFGLEIKPRKVDGNQSRWIRAQLKEKLPVGPRRLPQVETIKVGVSTGIDATTNKPKLIPADQGFYNATPLNVQVGAGIGFFPFGTEPRQFDQFYVASKEAFSKRLAAVGLDFNLELQTLGAPSVIKVGSGLRSYSLGLRRRLYELDLNGGGFNILGNPAENQSSSYLPLEHSAPSAITSGFGGIWVFVNTEDTLTADDPANKIWVHYHHSSQTAGSWTDLDAPGSAPATIRLRFSPAAITPPLAWAEFSRVFVVGADGKLYSRAMHPISGWNDHGNPGVSLDSPPFVVAAGDKIFVFVNGEGVVHWLPLDHNFTAQWRSLTPPNTQNFKASYRPFAQYFVHSGVDQAKVFVFGFTDPNNKTTGQLFECDTRDPADANQAVPWTALGQPTTTEITETAPEAHAPNGYLEDPTQTLGNEGRHIFLRGADNKLYERLDGTTSAEPQWQDRSRPGDPDLRGSPAVSFDTSGTTTTIQVCLASGRNSLVRWIFEANTISGVSTASAINLGVLLDPNLASKENGKYVDTVKKLSITAGMGSGPPQPVIAYDGGLALARLGTALATDPTSVCVFDGQNLGNARGGADRILAIHAPITDSFSASPIYLRIGPNFTPLEFYSRVTGMISINPIPGGSPTFAIYSELKGFDNEFNSPEDTGTVPELSWEYWNGRGWLSLSGVTDGTLNLLKNGLVTFTVPKDIQSTEVAGQENYWIRARLVGGDYGHETFKVVGTTIVSEKSSLRPPKVRTLRISYQADPVSPEACLSFNNLNYLDQAAATQTEGSHFQPFETLEDQSLTIFFGFDKPFKSGPVRLLLDAAERNYDENKPPELEWSFRKDRKWKKLDAEDGTVALTRQGILTISASEELTRETRFGESLFWIKGSLRTDRDASAAADTSSGQEKTSAAAANQTVFRCGEAKDQAENPCAATSDAAAELSQAKAVAAEYPLPLLRGVFLNTVLASQGETVTDEIIGSGDGEQNQIHNFQHPDVLEGEDIRIQEALSTEEREQIEREHGKESVTDRQDLGGTWVHWFEVKALFDCGPQDRCYEIDRATGGLRFGDGLNGFIPPAGVDNIRAFRYRIGGGSIGNVAADKIQALATAVAGIESVFNPTPAGGGADKADTNAMLTIGPRRISHRDRAVSVEDFEELAYEASRQVAKARCLSTTNLVPSGTGRPDPCDPAQLHEALEERGWVSLIIVPDSYDPQPCPSLELRRAVKEYVRDRAPSVVAAGERIVVRPPDYVIVSIHANIFVTTLEKATAAETQARTSLEKFLHPVHGGPDGNGWEFGRPISKSDIFAVLERIADIDRVEELSFQFRGRTDPDRVEIGPNELLASGEHKLAIKKS